jgi:NADH-quinone oxidoreductase subunit N
MEIQIPALDLWVIAPEILVLVTALLVMTADLVLGRNHKRWLAWLALAGVVLAAGLSGALWTRSPLVLQQMLVADGVALFLNLVILTAAALAILSSVEYVERAGLARGEYYTLLLLSTAGMMFMAAAVNLMTIFLALEILSLALYVLVGLNRSERRSGEAALKYLLLGAMASASSCMGWRCSYGQTGTTALAGVRDYVAGLGAIPPLLRSPGVDHRRPGLRSRPGAFQMWTPDVYEVPHIGDRLHERWRKGGWFRGAGQVALYTFGGALARMDVVLAILAALTMTVATLAALRQTNLKRMLAYSSIAHAGYILVGLAAGSELAGSAVLYYLFVYAFMNMAAFGRSSPWGGQRLSRAGRVAGRSDRAGCAEASVGGSHGPVHVLAGGGASSGRISSQAICVWRRSAGRPDLVGGVGGHQQRRVSLLLLASGGRHVHKRGQAGPG